MKRSNSLLSGSCVSFKTLQRPPLSDIENEVKLKNEKTLAIGIRILRKLRTLALNEKNPVLCQEILRKAHQFSHQLAVGIINQAFKEKPSPIDNSLIEILHNLSQEYIEQDDDSGHSIPPHFSIRNLFLATDDIFARIEEKV